MGKLCVIKDRKNSVCTGCCFNPRNMTHNMVCVSDDQVIDGIKYNCIKDAVIYKREKSMNEMPELKAGMIVEYKGSGNKYLYINDNWLMGLRLDIWTSFSSEHVNKIYSRGQALGTYINTCDDLKLIWSRKSEKDIKIENLEKTVKDALAQIEELKS